LWRTLAPYDPLERWGLRPVESLYGPRQRALRPQRRPGSAAKTTGSASAGACLVGARPHNHHPIVRRLPRTSTTPDPDSFRRRLLTTRHKNRMPAPRRRNLPPPAPLPACFPRLLPRPQNPPPRQEAVQPAPTRDEASKLPPILRSGTTTMEKDKKPRPVAVQLVRELKLEVNRSRNQPLSLPPLPKDLMRYRDWSKSTIPDERNRALVV